MTATHVQKLIGNEIKIGDKCEEVFKRFPPSMSQIMQGWKYTPWIMFKGVIFRTLGQCDNCGDKILLRMGCARCRTTGVKDG